MTSKTFNELFKETYYIACVDKASSKKYYLIQRYWDKASMRLKAESEKIYNDGKNKFSELLSQEILRHNRFLQHIPVSDFSGLYHQPVVLKRGEHF